MSKLAKQKVGTLPSLSVKRSDIIKEFLLILYNLGVCLRHDGGSVVFTTRLRSAKV